MQTQVASILMITSTVIFASIVVGLATTITQQTLSIEDNKQLERIQNLQDQMLNQTSTWLDGLQQYTTNITQTDP
jgi:flagellar biosynthesis protein FliQ